MSADAEIGVFGGSGFYYLLDDAEEVAVDTPYGPPSDRLVVGAVGGRRVAFLPRHGRHHHLPPHRDPVPGEPVGDARAGRAARDRPVRVGQPRRATCRPARSSSATSSSTARRAATHTFYDGPVTTHVSAADPYCPDLRRILLETGREQGIDIRDGGTVVVIQGPAILDAGRVEVVQLDGVGGHQHDRLPRGLARPRARALLREHLADHRLRRRRSRTTRASARSATSP